MSGIESFSGFEGLSQASSAEQYAEFKARMAASAAQLKAMQAGEQKQKKKEEELVRILLAFIQGGHKTSIIVLVVQLLEANFPAAFIIALLLINHPQIQEQTGLKLLKAPENILQNHEKAQELSKNTLPDLYFKNYTLPLEIKITIDAWVQEIAKMSEEHRIRLLKVGIDNFGNIKTQIIQLASLCLGEYLLEKSIDHDLNQVHSFVEIFIKGIFKRLIEIEPHQLN